MAEIELQHNKEWQAAGIAVAKCQGYTGRKHGTTEAKPERAKALHAKGLTVDEIMQDLGVKRSTVYNYLNTAKETRL